MADRLSQIMPPVPPVLDAAVRTACTDLGVDFDTYPSEVQATLTAFFLIADNYAQHVVTSLRDQLIAAVQTADDRLKAGLQAAIQALATATGTSPDEEAPR